MASKSFDLTTYYAKRIIGDTAAEDADKALLQTGANINTNTWILYRTIRGSTNPYGIIYTKDTATNGTADKIEFYGNGTSTAWIQLDTGDASFNSILGKVEITNISIPNTVTSYYFPYVSSSSSGVQALLTSSRIYLYEGTNRTHICIGSRDTRRGGITIWGENGSKYTDIITEAATSNKTVHIPNYTGWIAVGGDGSSTGVGNNYIPVYLSASGQLTTTTSYFVNGSTNSHQLGGFSVVAASTTHTDVANYAGHRLTLMTTDDGLFLWDHQGGDNGQGANVWSWRKNSSGIWQGSITGNAVTATRANITTTKYGIAYYSDAIGTFASTTYGAAGQVLIGKGSNDAADWYGGLTLTGTQASDWKVTINGTSSSSNTTTGALVVNGGVGIAGTVYTGSTLTTGGTISAGTTSTSSDISVWVRSTDGGSAAIYSNHSSSSRGLWFAAHGNATSGISAVYCDTNNVVSFNGALMVLKYAKDNADPAVAITRGTVVTGNIYRSIDIQDSTGKRMGWIAARTYNNTSDTGLEIYTLKPNSNTTNDYRGFSIRSSATDPAVMTIDSGTQLVLNNTTEISTSDRAVGALVVNGGASFASAIRVNGWVRTFGDNGWYSQTHGGGLCMRDDTYVRMYGNKQFLITSSITPSATNLSSQLIVSSLGHGTAADSLGSTSGGTVAIELWRGSNASWQISNNAGTLYFKNNWTTALQSTYSQTAMTIAYNTGNTTISGELTVNNLIKSTYNSNTVTIGSQNANWCHIYNSADVPFIFNKSVQVVGKANLGGTSYPWGNLYIGGNDNGIYFVGTKNNYRMIRFIDNTADIYGNGISIGGGGVTILGSGESSDTLITNLSLTGGAETTYIASDGNIEFYPSQQSYDVSAHFTMTDGRFWAGVNGNTTRETSVGAQSGAGQIYMWSHAATSGSRGIYVPAHGTGAAKTVLGVDTNNNVTFNGSLNGNAATATRINGNLTAATSDVNRNIWVSSTASADGIPNYISGFNMNPSTKVFTVPAGTRISPSAGALYLGNSGNQSWVYVQDICGQDGQKWKIHQNGNAEFTGTVTAPTFSGNASSADSLSGGLVTNTVTSHGNLAVTTAKGSYYGINFGHNASGMSIMSINASHQGLYNQTNGQWIIYYNAASTSKSISIGSSTVNITGGISLNLNTKITGTLEITGNQTITGAGAHWTKWQNTTTGVIISMWSDTTNQGIYSYSYWNGSANASGAGWILYRGTDSYVHTSFRLYGAVWNDYAEYRECDKLAPGTCVQEHNNGHLTQSDRRLIPGASIISDTFGFAEGQTEKADTPIAVSGRVLARTYRDRYEYHAGQAVCSAPDGTVDIMSRDEIMMYPDAIVGIVSEIPEYEEWGTDHIKVNNRIWIKVK